MAPAPIDLWNAATFDPPLTTLLQDDADLIRDYMVAEDKIVLDHDLAAHRSVLRPSNPHASAFVRLQETVGQEMQSRTIRAYHYARLTDDEVETLLRDGVHLSTPATLQARLSARVAAGDITAEDAESLYSASPFHSGQSEVRSNRFWMTSHPVAVTSGGVERLLAYWGGEVASFFLKDDSALVSTLGNVGTPRVIELGVPMAFTHNSFYAGIAAVATFGRSLGGIPDMHDFDVCTTKDLPSWTIMAVHSEGEPSFAAMGQDYPDGFASVDRWKELTGEDA